SFGSLMGALLTLITPLVVQASSPAKPDSSIEKRIRNLLERMTLEEKIDFLTGDRIKTNTVRAEGIKGIPRLRIPKYLIVHGPCGLKGRYPSANQKLVNGTWFSSSIMLASSWNPQLVQTVLSAMGYEMKRAGASANAGPSLNIIRDPRGGRSFEYFTEDPYLNGRMAVAYVKGLQSQKVMATLKHFVCNNQECNRNVINVKVSERALREIYLPGFRDAIVEGQAASVMAAYNRLNGIYCCENAFLLSKVLRDEWGFQGFVMSDWRATHSTEQTAMAGLNLEMPTERWYGRKMLAAVKQGKISKQLVDKLVSDILRMMIKFGVFEEAPGRSEIASQRPDCVAVARRAAEEEIVLLKNEGNLLPLDAGQLSSLAVIGPNGEYGPHFNAGDYDSTLVQGGGSAHAPVSRQQVVTIFQGLQEKLGTKIKVTYAPGCYAETGCGPIPARYLRTPDGKHQGLELKFYENARGEGKPVQTAIVKYVRQKRGKKLDIPQENNPPKNVKRVFWEWNAILDVPTTREYTFELRGSGGPAKLYING
ncbi:MAG: hypothetical protein D6820_05545, partial [Lentisphaerae bacterium]